MDSLDSGTCTYYAIDTGADKGSIDLISYFSSQVQAMKELGTNAKLKDTLLVIVCIPERSLKLD